MSSLVFLLSRKLKNRLREMLRRPSELIVLVVFVGLIGVTIFTGNRSLPSAGTRSVEEFYAIVLALYVFEFVLIAKNGFLNGASMFSMADVNLLFTSPKKPQTLLTFGLFSQLGRSLMLGVFILYQYAWVHDTYGVGLGTIIAVLVGYGAVAFLSQMLAMLIYSVTSSDDKRCRIAKAVFYAVVASFFVYLGFTSFSSGGELLSTVCKNANSPVMHFFPVAGFVRLGVVSAVSGDYKGLLLAVLCFVLCVAVFYILVSRLKSDYYEDVLKATEVSFSAITARKEGKAAETAPRNVKVGKTGFSRGEGASAIAEKHKLENRRSKVLILDAVNLVFAVVTIGLAFIIKDSLNAFMMNVYFSIFTVGTGRWAKELLLPYVYLIPEPPFKKLINMLREQLWSSVAEATLTFLPFYFILNTSPLMVLGMIFAKLSFNFLFIGVNLILQRFFGNGGNKALLVFLYFLLAALCSLPGVAAGVAMSALIPVFEGVMFFAMALVNILAGVIIIFCSRNILTTAEYNNK